LFYVSTLNPHVRAAALDKDWGSASLREGLLAGKKPGDIVAAWGANVERFMELRESYLLY